MPNDVLIENKMIEEWTNNMKAIEQFSESYIKAITYLIPQQKEMVRLYQDGSAKQLEALSQAKSIPDLIATQSSLFVEWNQKLMGKAWETLEELECNMRKIYSCRDPKDPPVRENYARAMTHLKQRQMEMISLYQDGTAKQLEALSQAKSIPDLIAAQSSLSTELNKKLEDKANQTSKEWDVAQSSLSTELNKEPEDKANQTSQEWNEVERKAKLQYSMELNEAPNYGIELNGLDGIVLADVGTCPKPLCRLGKLCLRCS